jgi:preprotein translocase subunit SecE
VARPTRSQRRARREAREQSLQTAGNGAPAAPPPVALAPAAPSERRRPGTFVQESWAELRKVEWPRQNQVVQGVVVVLIAMIVVGLYLYVCDEVFRRLVQNVFL